MKHTEAAIMRILADRAERVLNQHPSCEGEEAENLLNLKLTINIARDVSNRWYEEKKKEEGEHKWVAKEVLSNETFPYCPMCDRLIDDNGDCRCT